MLELTFSTSLFVLVTAIVHLMFRLVVGRKVHSMALLNFNFVSNPFELPNSHITQTHSIMRIVNIALFLYALAVVKILFWKSVFQNRSFQFYRPGTWITAYQEETTPTPSLDPPISRSSS